MLVQHVEHQPLIGGALLGGCARAAWSAQVRGAWVALSLELADEVAAGLLTGAGMGQRMKPPSHLYATLE